MIISFHSISRLISSNVISLHIFIKFVIYCVAFSIGALYTYVHYLCLQTYVLKIEIITNAVGIGLWIFEVAFAMLAFLGISGKESGI